MNAALPVLSSLSTYLVQQTVNAFILYFLFLFFLFLIPPTNAHKRLLQYLYKLQIS